MYRDRLAQIVDFAYDRIRARISGGRIRVENEHSFQLQFASLLKTVGEMFEVHKDEVFTIELEKPINLDGAIFGKSGTAKAKIDIWLCLENVQTGQQTRCAIELKFFKRDNQREPNNRYDVFADILNLESYESFADMGYMIVATDHLHYSHRKQRYSQNTADFDLRHGESYQSGTKLTYRTAKPYGAPITLTGSYNFVWDEESDGVSFLKLKVNPVRRG